MHSRGLLALNLPPKPRAERHAGTKRSRDELEGDNEEEEEEGEAEEEGEGDAGSEDYEEEEEEEEEAEQRVRLVKRRAVARRDDGTLVETVPVICNGMRGDFVVATTRVVCKCACCWSTALET